MKKMVLVKFQGRQINAIGVTSLYTIDIELDIKKGICEKQQILEYLYKHYEHISIPRYCFIKSKTDILKSYSLEFKSLR